MEDVLSNTLLIASIVRYAAASLRPASRSELFRAGLLVAASSIPAAFVSETRAIAVSAEFVSAFTERAASWYAAHNSFFALATCSGLKDGDGLAVVEALPDPLGVGRARSMMPTTSAATAIKPIATNATTIRPFDAGLPGSAGGVHGAAGGSWGFVTFSRLITCIALSLQATTRPGPPAAITTSASHISPGLRDGGAQSWPVVRPRGRTTRPDRIHLGAVRSCRAPVVRRRDPRPHRRY